MPRAAWGYCPNALPNCPCLNDRPDFVMPNWTEYFTTQWKPPLLQPPPLQAKLPGRNATDFQKLLPINDIIQELFNTVSEEIYKCYEPVIRHSTVLTMANQPKSRYYKKLEACKAVPVPRYYKDKAATVASYVYGAFSDLSALPTSQLNLLPRLKLFRYDWSKLGPHMSVCVATNPCEPKLYIGFKRMATFLVHEVKWGADAFSRLNMRLEKLAYSPYVDVAPLDWQTPNGVVPLAVWSIQDPLVLTDLGQKKEMVYLAQTTKKGTQYVEGALSNQWGANVIVLRTVAFDLGPQRRAWVFVRDANHIALSLGMSTAPDITLWGKLQLSFRTAARYNKAMYFRRVQMTSRASDCTFWVTAPGGQTVPAQQLAYSVPALGKVLERIFPDIKVADKDKKIVTALHVRGAGTRGPPGSSTSVAVRLEFGTLPGGNDTWRLSTAAAAAFNLKSLTGKFAVILTAEYGASEFFRGGTLDYVNPADGRRLPESQRVFRTCASFFDCPQDTYYDERGLFDFYYDCDQKKGVCIVKQIAGAAVAAAVGTQRPEPPLSPEPSGAAAAAQRSVGEPCRLLGVGRSTCPWPLVCRMDTDGNYACREVGE